MSTGSRSWSDFGVLFEMAQINKGLPWFLTRSDTLHPYLGDTRVTSYAMNVSHFSNDNLTMEELGDNTVSFTYTFCDFQGSTPVPTNKQVLLKTRCQAFDPVEDQETPGLGLDHFSGRLVPGLRSSNFSEFEHKFQFRWIFNDIFWLNETIETCTSTSGSCECLTSLDY